LPHYFTRKDGYFYPKYRTFARRKTVGEPPLSRERLSYTERYLSFAANLLKKMDTEKDTLETVTATTGDGVAAPPASGRGKWLDRYRESHPDTANEPDDEMLFAFADEGHTALDEKHRKLSDANTRLAELVARDPRLAAVLSMIAGDKPVSLPYAVAKIYGKQPFDLEGEELEDFERGHGEYLERNAKDEEDRQKALSNIAAYHENLEKFAKDNSLPDEKKDELHGALMNLAEQFLMGDIPVQLIELTYKGIHHDADVREAADTGYVEGRNENIDAKLHRTAGAPSVPDLKSATGAGRKTPPPAKKTSFYDSLKEVPDSAPR
jgi:hypothetical protein